MPAVLRGLGFGGRAGGGPPRTPVTFVGCIVGSGFIRLETHDATVCGNGFLPSTMRDGVGAGLAASSSTNLNEFQKLDKFLKDVL